jgi:hypothetical protein
MTKQIMIEIDNEDYEYLQDMLEKLEDTRDRLLSALVSVWKEHGEPEPNPDNKPDINIASKPERDYENCDDEIVARSWVRYGDSIPVDARRYWGQFMEVKGRIRELSMYIHIIKESYNEKIVDK